MAVETQPKAQVFSLRTPYLSEGRTTTLVSETDSLWVHVKVYAQGGENALHAHSHEDHAFIILEGQATFYDKDGNTTVVDRYQGIMLPKGAYYYFQSTGDTNLVLMRVGGGQNPYRKSGQEDRWGPDGKPLPSYSAENKRVEGVPIPGRFFGD